MELFDLPVIRESGPRQNDWVGLGYQPPANTPLLPEGQSAPIRRGSLANGLVIPDRAPRTTQYSAKSRPNSANEFSAFW
jgi:hypothetical protein